MWRRAAFYWYAVVVKTLLALALLLPMAGRAEQDLSIINAAVSPVEDAPFSDPGYKFLPGDTVYLSFQIAGFTSKFNQEAATRAIDLSYQVSMFDERGTVMAKAVSGAIKEELTAEDKNWLPKRRAAFVIPDHVAAGDCHVHVTVTDALNGKTTERDVPVHVGGEHIEAAASVAIENFRFLRDENATAPLDVAAYRPGETIYLIFDIVGFELKENNSYDVSYAVSIMSPGGKPYLRDGNAVQLADSSFYPAQYLRTSASVATTADSSRGAYTLTVTVTDKLSGKTSSQSHIFTLE